MEDFNTRQVAVAAIRARVTPVTGNWLNDCECVQVAISASCREPLEVLGLLFAKPVVVPLAAKLREVAITLTEWAVLFGHETRHTRTAESLEASKTELFIKENTRVESALRSTIIESVQKAAWTRPVNRVATHVGLHFESYAEALESTLGNVVRSDLRRLDDLREDLDQRGVSTMHLASLVTALGVAAC
jgi:hypothetical protein